MTEPITVRVETSYWTAYRANLRLAPYSLTYLIASIPFPIAGLYLVYLFIRRGRWLTVSELLIVVLAFGFTPLITALSLFLARLRNKLARGPLTYTFDGEGIHIVAEMGTSNIKWAAIVRAVETKTLVFLFFAPSKAFYVPKEQLGAGQLQKFRELLKLHVAKLRGPAW